MSEGKQSNAKASDTMQPQIKTKIESKDVAQPSNNSPMGADAAQRKLSESLPASQEDASKQEDASMIDDGNVDLILVDLNAKEIPLKIPSNEIVVELRELLNEHVYTCFFTNYVLEHNGEKVNELMEVQELDLATNNRIFMRPEKYNDRSARAHIKRVVDILENPCVLSNHSSKTNKDSKPETRARTTSQSSQGHQLEESKQTAEPKQAGDDLDQEIKSLLMKRANDYNSLLRNQKEEDFKTPQDQQKQTKSTQAEQLFTQLYDNPISISSLNKLNHIKCIESIQFSQFNPVTAASQMQGDLFYLAVRTLENPNQEQVITCSVNGFYKNESTEKGSFNPNPTTRSNPCYSYSLVGCLAQLSQNFASNLQTLINSILETDAYFLTKCQPTDEHWLSSTAQSKKIVVSGSNQMSQTLVPLYGLDPQISRDWNEEFQVFKTFPRDNFMQRLQIDRNIVKTYNEFMDAAREGAIAIVDGKLQALNPNEPLRAHVYVYNQIFFSFSVDCPTSYSDLATAESNPSFTQSNHDLTGLRLLQGMAGQIQGIHHLATTIINYKGHRLLCQSIIPGILNNQELASMAEYGTIDEKKSIVANEEFHKQMLKIAEALSIKVNKFIDPTSGNSVEIAGSAEVKGIKGSDKRHYIVDLQGLTPRDANFVGDEYHSCLVRPELIASYQKHKNMVYAGQKMEIFSKKMQEEREKELKAEEEKGVEVTDEIKAQRAKKRYEDHQKHLKEVERVLAEAPKYTFNVNVFKSNCKLDMTPEQIKADENEVRELSTFLKETQLPGLISDLKQVESFPHDSVGLEAFLHQRGVNMRYLGQLITLLNAQPAADKKDESAKSSTQSKFKHVKTLLEREVFVRCAKHVFMRILREETGESDLHLSQVVSHVLNCLLAPAAMQGALNSERLRFHDESVQSHFEFCPEETIPSPRRGRSDSQNLHLTPTKKADEAQSKVSDFNAALGTEQALKQKAQAQATQGSQEPAMSKAQKKKQRRKNQAEDSTKVPSDAKSEPNKIEDFLFTQQTHFSGAQEAFDVQELFSLPHISTGLYRLKMPHALTMRPEDIYQEICTIAQKRFEHQLPTEMKKLACMSSPISKQAVLREICLKVGIQLKCDPKKNFRLSNNMTEVIALVNTEQEQEHLSSQSATAKKKKKEPFVQLTEADILADYKYLPFHSTNIEKMFATMKHMRDSSVDAKAMLINGSQALANNQFERALDMISQSIHLSMQHGGPMQIDIAQCIIKMANIHFKSEDALQAIELQTKALVILERILGLDNPQVAINYSTLAMYYHGSGFFTKGFEYMWRALSLMQLSAGEYHPDIANIYLNLGMMYQEVDNHEAAIEVYQRLVQQNSHMFGENHIQTAQSNSALAQAQYRNKDFRKAVQTQEKTYNSLKNILPADSPYLKNAKDNFDTFLKMSVNYERVKNEKAKTIGTNKNKGNPNSGNQLDPQLLQILQQREKLAAMMAEKQEKVPEEESSDKPKMQSQDPQQKPKLTAEETRKLLDDMMAQQHYAQLMQRMKNPKNRNPLDILEYQSLISNSKNTQASGEKQEPAPESSAPAKEGEDEQKK